jgi:hypothetical protein
MPIDGTISRFSEGTNKLLRRESLEPPMSQLGHFQTSADATTMSAFLPLATTERTSLEVRFVPEADQVSVGPVPDRARHASRRQSRAGEGAECTAAQTAAAPREEARTATTSTADIPRRWLQAVSGYARPQICSAT